MIHKVPHWGIEFQYDIVWSCTVAEIDEAIPCRACPRAVDPRAEREAEPPAHDSGARRGRQVGGRRPGEGVCAIDGAQRRRRRRRARWRRGWRRRWRTRYWTCKNLGTGGPIRCCIVKPDNRPLVTWKLNWLCTTPPSTEHGTASVRSRQGDRTARKTICSTKESRPGHRSEMFTRQQKKCG